MTYNLIFGLCCGEQAHLRLCERVAVPENPLAPTEQVNPLHIADHNPSRSGRALPANLANFLLHRMCMRAVLVPQFHDLGVAIQATTIEAPDAQDSAGWIVQPDLPDLHLIVDFVYDRDSAVLQQSLGAFETLFHNGPDVPLLLHSEPHHHVDHFCDDELGQSRVTGEADDKVQLTTKIDQSLGRVCQRQ
jgi:hypothetical protein